MLKKVVKFTDYNGNEHSEDVYFHVSKTSVLTAPDDVYNEIVKIGQDLQEKGKFLSEVEGTIDENNPFDKNGQLLAESIRMVARLLDRLVDLSYGEKSPDGMKFVKNQTVLSEFKNSVVYDAFIEQMISNQDELIDFIKSLLGQ